MYCIVCNDWPGYATDVNVTPRQTHNTAVAPAAQHYKMTLTHHTVCMSVCLCVCVCLCLYLSVCPCQAAASGNTSSFAGLLEELDTGPVQLWAYLLIRYSKQAERSAK